MKEKLSNHPTIASVFLLSIAVPAACSSDNSSDQPTKCEQLGHCCEFVATIDREFCLQTSTQSSNLDMAEPSCIRVFGELQCTSLIPSDGGTDVDSGLFDDTILLSIESAIWENQMVLKIIVNVENLLPDSIEIANSLFTVEISGNLEARADPLFVGPCKEGTMLENQDNITCALFFPVVIATPLQLTYRSQNGEHVSIPIPDVTKVATKL